MVNEAEGPLHADKFGAQLCLVVLPSFTVAGTVAADSGEARAGLVETEVGSRNNMCLGLMWQVGSGPAKRKAAWREAELHCGYLFGRDAYRVSLSYAYRTRKVHGFPKWCICLPSPFFCLREILIVH